MLTLSLIPVSAQVNPVQNADPVLETCLDENTSVVDSQLIRNKLLFMSQVTLWTLLRMLMNVFMLQIQLPTPATHEYSLQIFSTLGSNHVTAPTNIFNMVSEIFSIGDDMDI